MLTVSRQNSSCQEGWTICNGRGLIHHLLYPTTLYLFYLKVLFINQFRFYWRGNLSFFIMCHYTTPFAAITLLIRPQVYPQTQTLEQTDAEIVFTHTHVHSYSNWQCCVMLTALNMGDVGRFWCRWRGEGVETEVRVGRIDNETERRGWEWAEGGGGSVINEKSWT